MSDAPWPSPSAIHEAADAIRRGELVGMPTETVYGLAGDATSGQAVARIFEAKGRPTFNPLIVHVASSQQAWDYVDDVPKMAYRLTDAFWPGPLTLVLPRQNTPTRDRPGICDLVTAGLDTVAVRVPGHPVARQLIEASGVPLAAPSANRSGAISPTSAQDVNDELGDAMAMVLDAGRCDGGLESTVVGFARHPDGQPDGQVVVYRLGGVTLEALQEIADVVVASESAGNAPPSPGMGLRHYAPQTPMTIVSTLSQAMAKANPSVGLLLPSGEVELSTGRFARVEILSVQGDLREAAASLFAILRRLDGCGLSQIVAVKAEDRGLGRAINDRLTRAAAPQS